VAEGRAVRERAGIIDLSSFGKIDVTGPGALRLLQHVSANDVDRPVGAVVYTPWCDDNGGMVADVTVTRLGDDRFRVVTGAGFVANDRAWLVANRPAGGSADRDGVEIRDVSDDLATIGLWGPRARDILARATHDDVGDGALPNRRAREIAIAGATVLAARISYAGELGWELTMPSADAVPVWDALWRLGAEDGLEPFGYRALDALRMEKGYRYYGVDMTMRDSVFGAGLEGFVRLGKGPFLGRGAVVAASEQGHAQARLRTVLIGGTDYLPIYGGEAVRAGGQVIGRLRSVAFGPTIGRTIGYVSRPSGLDDKAPLEVDVFDKRIPATWAADVLVDPAGDRMRG
jgi:4-methylaminobutanoate oxidase (formaldehyde-forming)